MSGRWDSVERGRDIAKRGTSSKKVKVYDVMTTVDHNEVRGNRKNFAMEKSTNLGNNVSVRTTQHGTNKIGALREACPSIRKKELIEQGYTSEEADRSLSNHKPHLVVRTISEDSVNYRKQKTNKKTVTKRKPVTKRKSVK